MPLPSIILIGPSKAGKTTLAQALGEAMGWSWLDLDKLRWGYYAEIGYDPGLADAHRRHGGIVELAGYWRPFDVYGVERVLQDYPTDHVIAFGAGHSYYDDPALFKRAREALEPYPHVILLLPSPDVEESTAELERRLRESEPDMAETSIRGIMAMNRTFLTHPSNALLATRTVYTLGKSIEQSVQEILYGRA